MTEHSTPCQTLQECSFETKRRLTSIEGTLVVMKPELDKMSEMAENVEKIADMMEAMSNVRGFAVTLWWLGKIVLFIGAVSASVVALKHYFSG